jgi:hypothetical protein
VVLVVRLAGEEAVGAYFGEVLLDGGWATRSAMPAWNSAKARTFLRSVAAWRGPRRYRLVPTRANGQPACGFYVAEGSQSAFGAHRIIVLTLEGDRISAITRFVDNGVMGWFGLPQMLDCGS